MIAALTDEQIDQVLITQVVGRIGCHAEGMTYVVPVAYAFDGTFLYAHSKDGRKIEMMRKNPQVCFQVDIIENLANWRSVIVHGDYEELKTGPLQAEAARQLQLRLGPVVTSDAANPLQPPPAGEKRMRPVYFRIAIRKKSGRFEKR